VREGKNAVVFLFSLAERVNSLDHLVSQNLFINLIINNKKLVLNVFFIIFVNVQLKQDWFLKNSIVLLLPVGCLYYSCCIHARYFITSCITLDYSASKTISLQKNSAQHFSEFPFFISSYLLVKDRLNLGKLYFRLTF